MIITGSTNRRRLRRRPAHGAPAAAVAVAALAAGLLAGCGAGPPAVEAGIRLPTTDCTLATRSLSVPLTVASLRGGSIDVVPVCVDGHGPYPFALDTGAAASVVDAGLARTLRLPAAAPSSQAVGVGCATARSQVYVASWSTGGVPLSAQPVLVSDDPWFGPGMRPRGVLGGDVLSRFGALRLDFRSERMALLAPEAAAPSHASFLSGDPAAPPPPLLVHTTPRAVAVLTVLKFSGRAEATASASLGGRRYPFLVDTGTARSAVSAAAAGGAHLPATGHRVPAPGVGCRGTVGEVATGSWQVGSVALPAQALATVALAGGTQSGVAGALGLDVLGSYGSVVLDYRTGLLWLGAG